MEKRVSMKIFSTVCLSSLLWLAGCASTGVSTISNQKDIVVPTASDRTTNAATTNARQPIIPAGVLQPITAVQANSETVAQLTPPADLWERIRRGFSMPNLESDLVTDREQWYSTRPDYMLRMTERSRKYLFHIVEELERRNMPTELALLPFIESTFNPQAVSSAKAAGMWQFMPATGKHSNSNKTPFAMTGATFWPRPVQRW